MDVPADKRDERGVLATLIPPAVKERRSEWPNSDARERRRADAHPEGEGSGGGPGRARRHCGANPPYPAGVPYWPAVEPEATRR